MVDQHASLYWAHAKPRLVNALKGFIAGILLAVSDEIACYICPGPAYSPIQHYSGYGWMQSTSLFLIVLSCVGWASFYGCTFLVELDRRERLWPAKVLRWTTSATELFVAFAIGNLLIVIVSPNQQGMFLHPSNSLMPIVGLACTLFILDGLIVMADSNAARQWSEKFRLLAVALILITVASILSWPLLSRLWMLLTA